MVLVYVPTTRTFSRKTEAGLTHIEDKESRLKLVDLTAGCREFGANLAALPYSLRVLLENALRRGDRQSAERIVRRKVGKPVAFLPARILLQDMLGVPVMVDLSSMRDAAQAHGAAPEDINPRLPVDLVIDHSLIPVHFGAHGAREKNEAIELEMNRERYRFLHWCQSSFSNVRIIPPGKGIMHQINIEFLARGYQIDDASGAAYPDTVYGTDSHTPMVNGIGVVGWGVGGLEAEMAMLGRETSFPVPEVIGIKLVGARTPGITATDLVLTITERLRQLGVVGKFVEFCGDSLDELPAADRCTISNMAPEYGATCVYFPIDRQTIDYLSLSGRDAEHVAFVERCARAQALWRETGSPLPDFDELIEIDLSEIVPSIAGPRRPQDRVPVREAHKNIEEEFVLKPSDERHGVPGNGFDLGDGDIVIAAITSCTNTSNPAVVIGAALLARNALERGLTAKPWIKTSFAPGSQVVADYLGEAGLQQHLDALGFHIVGFGCTTCNGGSGPLAEPIVKTIEEHDLTCAAVLSGNRNFAGRIHPHCRANYIMSPPLVVAYALAGSMRIDVSSAPLGVGNNGKEVYLKDIWPSDEEIAKITASTVKSHLFADSYDAVLDGGSGWDALGAAAGTTFEWEEDSTYLKSAPYFDVDDGSSTPKTDLQGLRPLVMVGDSITTDHISPSGAILADSAAGAYLQARGVAPSDFNTFGTRRGNHEVAMRSAFANNRLQNEIIPGSEGSITLLMPDRKRMTVFDAACAYRSRGVGLVVIAGKEYGCGSSRDTAAKCVKLLGVRAVIAESYERIHRSNLVGMGILPLQFMNGEGRKSLGLTGEETFDIIGVGDGLRERCELTLAIHYPDGRSHATSVRARLDTPDDVAYVQAGGVLPFVFEKMVVAGATA